MTVQYGMKSIQKGTMGVQLETNTFWKILTAVFFAAISVYKVAEHGKDIKHIKEKLEPADNEHRLMTAEDVEKQLMICDRNHEKVTKQIFRDIAEIKHTLQAGEDARNKARGERSHHLEKLTDAIDKLEAKLK